MQESPPLSPLEGFIVKNGGLLIFLAGILFIVVLICDIVAYVLMTSPDSYFFFMFRDEFMLLQLLLAAISFAVIFIWKADNRRLKRIRDGLFAHTAPGIIKTGKILAMGAIFLSTILALIGMLLMFASARIGATKDLMIAQLTEIGANAYQYRLRETSLGGGGGTYTGYTLPTILSVNEYGITYTANVVHPDSVQLKAAIRTIATVSITIDSTSRMADRWVFTGPDF